MAKRDNHYESAFEAYLRASGIPYIAVDETKRALLGGSSLKSLDFVVSTALGPSWLVDVKGRRFPAGTQKQYWKNWSTRDDLHSLTAWQRLLGPRFTGLFIFAYDVVGDIAPLPAEELFAYRDHLYGFVGLSVAQYTAHCRPLSAKWGTVAMPTKRFRELARPARDFFLRTAAIEAHEHLAPPEDFLLARTA